MNQDAFDTFYALLTVAGQLALVTVAVLWLLRGRTPWWNQVSASLAPVALWLATLVAAVAVVGSLQLSLGAGYTPCTLCWYQRIAIYPLVIVCGVAALRRDVAVRFTVWPLAAIRASISIWNYVHGPLPEAGGASCVPVAPCTVLWIWKLHYISIPMMALTTMALIAVLVGIARADGERTEVAHTSAAGTDEVSKSSTPERTSP